VSCKVFVGNLPWKTTGADLDAVLDDMGFSHQGARVITDRETGKSRGFAFVEFDTPEAAAEAIRELDGHVLDGRPLRANEAEDRPRGGGGGGRDRRGGEGRLRRGRGPSDDVWGD
jgi:RNA recognition motif-containing protein